MPKMRWFPWWSGWLVLMSPSQLSAIFKIPGPITANKPHGYWFSLFIVYCLFPQSVLLGIQLNTNHMNCRFFIKPGALVVWVVVMLLIGRCLGQQMCHCWLTTDQFLTGTVRLKPFPGPMFYAGKNLSWLLKSQHSCHTVWKLLPRHTSPFLFPGFLLLLAIAAALGNSFLLIAAMPRCVVAELMQLVSGFYWLRLWWPDFYQRRKSLIDLLIALGDFWLFLF